jgi:hypothetical protein
MSRIDPPRINKAVELNSFELSPNDFNKTSCLNRAASAMLIESAGKVIGII